MKEEKNVVQIGVFFDGTGNNGENVKSFAGWSEKDKKSKRTKAYVSYWMSRSNVYRLYEMYSGDESIYIEGIGTLCNGVDDDSRIHNTKVFGDVDNDIYGYGGRAKIKSALEKLDKFIRTHSESKSISVDLFGFSRGAALARHFANIIAKLIKNDEKYKNLNINFLGLFDTVEEWGEDFKKYFNSSVKKDVANKVFQLCALHEARVHFPLTSIFDNAEPHISLDKLWNQSDDSSYVEWIVPGCHSDIGGGYNTYLKENFPIDSIYHSKENEKNKEKEENKQYLLSHPIWKNIFEEKNLYEIEGYFKNRLGFKRELDGGISGNLQWVNLLIMVDEAEKAGCNFNKIKEEETGKTIQQDYREKLAAVTPLQEYYKNITQQDKQKVLNNLDKVIEGIRDFIHVSVNYYTALEIFRQTGIDPKSEPVSMQSTQLKNNVNAQVETVLDSSSNFVALNEIYIGNRVILNEGLESGFDRKDYHPMRAHNDWNRVILSMKNMVTTDVSEAV